LFYASELVALARIGELVPIEAEARPDERHRRPVPEGIEIEVKRELVKDI
jgi:hypothetical protein